MRVYFCNAIAIMLKEFPFYNVGMMTPETKGLLFSARILAAIKLHEIEHLVAVAQKTTGEDGMTADFVWGNCSLQELERALTEGESQTA